MYEMLEENFLVPFDEDERMISYHPIRPIDIFCNRIEPANCVVNLSKKLTWVEAAPVVLQYIEWLNVCESQLIDYFHSKCGEDLPHNWFESIEVYFADITVLALDDFGATIHFGESLFPDHVIELDFEQFEMVSERLNG